MAFEDLTVGMGLLILGGILIAVAQFGLIKNAKSRKNTTRFGLGLAVFVGIFLFALPGTLTFLEGPLSFGGNSLSTVATTGGVITGCNVDDTTVTLSAQNKYTASAVGGTHRYRINGNPALTVSDAGSFTASPGDSIEILWTNGTGSGGNYFAEVDTEIVPCKGTTTLSTDLYQNGTLTIEVFNEEGNLIADPENETLANGDVVSLSANLKGTFQRGLPLGGVIVAEYNKTVIDDLIVDFGGSEVAFPSLYSPTLGTESGTKAYSVPSIISNQILSGTITIDADDTNNPGDTGDPILTFYPNNFFINEKTGGSFDGPSAEDEDDVQTFSHITSFTLSVD